jgi:hypothetical protein
MTTSEAFLTFKSALELPDGKFAAASAAQQTIRERLSDHLFIPASFLAGSYARHTKIDPLKDIDIILVRNTERVGLTSGGTNTPAKALEEVVTAAWKAYPKATCEIQNRSINVSIPGIAFGFDLVPAWLRAPNGYWIPDTDIGTWIPTDPDAHSLMMTKANAATDGRLKPVVKMMKHWNAMNLDLMRSFHVELICRDVLLTGTPSSFQACVAKVLGALPHFVGKTYLDPAYGQTRVDKPLTAAEADTLLIRCRSDAGTANAALALEADGQHSAAIEKWKYVFISGFPQ